MGHKDYFEFKRFVVHQRHAAMKVGTDGTLLGSLGEGGDRILDIGTGTGLISLMMAQRFPESEITAIEIDENAVIDARRNFAESPFCNRLHLLHTSLKDFVAERIRGNDGGMLFDSIVCNPPYFDDSLESKDLSRTRARHTSSLPFHELISSAYKLLEDKGVFSVCIPPEVLDKFSAECLINGFGLKTVYAIRSVPRKPNPKRYIMIYQKNFAAEPQEYSCCLQDADGSRSDWYADLLRDFYL